MATYKFPQFNVEIINPTVTVTIVTDDIINKVKLENNVAYFVTATIQEFTEGQSVIITGCGAPFNGTHTAPR